MGLAAITMGAMSRAAGQLDGRCRLAAEGRTAVGGEHHEVRAARHLGGGAHRVERGCVHEHQSLAGGHPFGVLVDGVEIGGSPLGDRAERLLDDRRQPSGLVARRGIVVDDQAPALGELFPPPDALHQLAAHLFGGCPGGEQVFGAVALGGFREDGGAALAHQQVHCMAQCRVAADAQEA